VDVVVVGGGLAGAAAVGALRADGFDGRLTLIGDETLPPYERPPLSKEYLRGEETEPHLVHPEPWYAEQEVDLRLGTRASRLVASERVVELAGGERVAFDAAILATGSRPRRPPIPGLELEGVFDLRVAGDADRIKAVAAGSRRAVLVGMGFIGAEVAASLRHLGLDVTVVEPFSVPLERVLGPILGGAIASLHRDHGVEMIFGDLAERFDGAGRFEALVTRAGRRIEGDLAILGVGVEPVTEIAGPEVEVGNGIVVDETLRTAAPGVFAIGDVALHDHPVFGPVRVEHFDKAIKQGEAVARNVLGADEPFADAMWFWSDQYDSEIQMSGYATAWDDMVVRGSIEERSFAAFLLQNGVLRSTVTMDWKLDARRSMPLIAAEARPERELLADPELDLRTLHPPKDAP
jgi:3-phenylpropionate/trans-cinnamate dioxygenase ferredoxin reductase component